MKPDITLLNQQREPSLLMDVKWKLLDSSDNKYGVSQPDMYQILSYAHQYDCKKVVLIYPQYKGITAERPVFRTLVGEVNILIWTVDLAGIVKRYSDISGQLNEILENALGEETA